MPIIAAFFGMIVRIFNADHNSPHIHARIYEGLGRGGMFEKCLVELGALAWPNGFELCPDALKMWDRSQHHPKKMAA
jgi:hypothetical protein